MNDLYSWVIADTLKKMKMDSEKTITSTASTEEKQITNREKFKEVFGLYATEVWAMPEDEFLAWAMEVFK